MDRSLNAHIKKAPTDSKWVWFEGATALLEGQGVCFNWDYGTPTAFDGRRGNRVELPTILNARYFAGVAARKYSAKANGQFIEIYCPGSSCNVLSKASTTIGVGRLTCEAGGTYAGYFRYEGFEGEGSCVPLQTVNNGTTAGKCMAILEQGPPSGLVESVSITTAGGAIVCMVGGVTYFPANVLTDANATFTLADGVLHGQKKGFATTGDQTTNNIVITVTSGLQDDGATGFGTWTTDTALEEVYFKWHGIGTGGLWVEEMHVGGTIG